MDLKVINLEQADKWLEILDMCNQYDFFHCPTYHEISTQNRSYEANLIAYQEGSYTIAIPLIIRPVNEIHGLESFNSNDVTSIYGYLGPIASHHNLPERPVKNFQNKLREYFFDKNVVCVFSRLHPLINQEPILEGFGDVRNIGKTISISLSLTLDEQYSRYRENHKRDIRKLRQLGAHCTNDHLAEHSEDFVAIYHENMKRVGAQEDYFHNQSYFQKLLGAKDLDMHLVLCFLEGDIACGGLFSLCKGIVQYYLGATNSKYLRLAPMKLMIDEVRIWANESGASYFHLGGGRVSLLKFKAGFSDTVHDLNVWQLIVLKKKYQEICRQIALWNEQGSHEPIDSDYFPLYRCPTT